MGTARKYNIYDNVTTVYHLKKNRDGSSTNQMTSITSGIFMRHVKMLERQI